MKRLLFILCVLLYITASSQTKVKVKIDIDPIYYNDTLIIKYTEEEGSVCFINNHLVILKLTGEELKNKIITWKSSNRIIEFTVSFDRCIPFIVSYKFKNEWIIWKTEEYIYVGFDNPMYIK